MYRHHVSQDQVWRHVTLSCGIYIDIHILSVAIIQSPPSIHIGIHLSSNTYLIQTSSWSHMQMPLLLLAFAMTWQLQLMSSPFFLYKSMAYAEWFCTPLHESLSSLSNPRMWLLLDYNSDLHIGSMFLPWLHGSMIHPGVMNCKKLHQLLVCQPWLLKKSFHHTTISTDS